MVENMLKIVSFSAQLHASRLSNVDALSYTRGVVLQLA